MTIGPKLAFIDVDGTLVGSDLSIAPATASAITQAQRAGFPIILASGRPFESMEQLAAGVGIDFPILIGYGGSAVCGLLPHGKVNILGELGYDVRARVAEAINTGGVGAFAYGPSARLAFGNPDLLDIEARRSGLPYDVISQVDALVDQDIIPELFKVLLIAADGIEAEELKEEMSPALMGSASVTSTYPEYVEVTPPLVSKRSAAALVAKSLGLELEESLVIGDGENDIEILSATPWSVCVANAHPNARSVAHYLAPSNDEDGVAVAIEHFLLGSRSANSMITQLSPS